MRKIIREVVGPLETNCYFIIVASNAIIVDPGGDASRLLNLIKKFQLSINLYLLTHSHYDHIAALGELLRYVKAPIAIHTDDADSLADPRTNFSMLMGDPQSYKADRLLSDGDIIKLSGEDFTVMHTPGHTPGSISLLGDGFILSGDTLFRQGIGRTDIPGGSENQIYKSLRKLLELPSETIVYPGHGESTTIGEAKKFIL